MSALVWGVKLVPVNFTRQQKGGTLLDIMEILAPIGMCLAAIVVAAAVYFVVTFIKGKIVESRERRAAAQKQQAQKRQRPRY